MFVVATAGHVDHGKSTLVRALTGIEPDRWDEEHRRGLTIDIGFAWTTLPSGADIAFVDVPGHQRFLGNMLAGIGPAPVVMFVVAADEGWRAQSAEHRDAVAALGIDRGVLVITRADRAGDARIAEVINATRTEFAHTGLHDAPHVVVSATTGAGLHELRTTLDTVLGTIPPAALDTPVRMWVDRSFSVSGAGTVVTGTLAAGTLSGGDELELHTDSPTPRLVTVRGLQSESLPLPRAHPVRRVAVNLRGIAADDIVRGDVLLTPGHWHLTASVDVRRVSGPALDDLPSDITAHVGTVATGVHIRPFDAEHARLTFARTVPLTIGDRVVLRDPGSHTIAGVRILDAEPPALSRRGDGTRRAGRLKEMGFAADSAREVSRRGAVPVEHLIRLGIPDPSAHPIPGILVEEGWAIDETRCAAWVQRLISAVTDHHDNDPLAAGLTLGAARSLLGLPDDALLDVVIARSGVVSADGVLSLAERIPDLGTAEDAVAALERRLGDHPFRAPEADDLTALGLGARELAAAERLGRVLRLADGVILLPTAPALAMRSLTALEQPFTTSAARKTLGTTRRVVIPLLEHLDGRGWTRRLDAGHREVITR